jgi:hypothetical protein
MSRIPAELLTWMQAHHATICHDAVERAGLSINDVKALVRDGTVARVLHGGYRFAGVEASEEVRCAAVSTARPDLVVAGPTAARLWGLRRAPRDRLIHVIAPPRSHPCVEPWFRPYRTARIRPSQIVERDDGIRLTSPARTVIDHARFLDARNLSSMIECVLASSYATVATLQREAKWLATPGRPWAKQFVEVLEARVPGAGAESEWEDRIAGALVARGVTGLVRQYWLKLPGCGKARLDLAVPDLRWGLEVDVHPAHLTELGQVKDAGRDRACRAIHWFVDRIREVALRAAFDREMDAMAASIVSRRREVEALRTAGVF